MSTRFTTSVMAGLVAAVLAPLSGPAAALQPAEVYAKVAPSVWRVQTYDVDGLPIGIGSGVVIAPDTLVTNCHVLAKAKRVAVKREKISIDAKLEMWDPQRDVCQIKAPNLGAPVVALGEVSKLKVGQTVYAVGNPKGLDLTMSAGLLSSVRRNTKDQIILLQTSAAISGGSSGGGLFDDEGVLIGLTTLGSVSADAQNLNFAVPVDWVRELPQRHAKLLAKPGATTAAASSASAAAPVLSASPSASATGAAETIKQVVMSGCVGAGKLPAPPLPTDTAMVDSSRLPYAGDKMRDSYKTFLTCPLPRAFAISEGGKWWYSWSTKPADTTLPADPTERALRACEKTNSGKCFLYAIDNSVVYEGRPAGATK
jgi:serine protease Do